jgi:serine/threonine protein kinase
VDKDNVNMMRAIIKIIDFGFATHIGKSNLVYTALGSPINMDPTILKKMTEKNSGMNAQKMIGYDQKADIWSLGTLCYEMIIGKSAFNCKSMEELVQKVESGNYAIPTHLSKELVSFLNGMLQYNAQKRLSANELARHHFLTKNVRDFEPIDVRRVSNKIRQNNLNINIKKNNTIWSIFNEEDEDKLINVPTNYLMPMDSPINEEEEFKRPPSPGNKRRNTEKIPQIQKYNINPLNEIQQPQIPKTNTFNGQGYGTGYKNEISPYNNANYQGGVGFGNYPNPNPYMGPHMAPHFPYPQPMMNPFMGPNPRGQMMGPPSGPFIGAVEPPPMRNQMNGERFGPPPFMQFPPFGVPSPGEDPNAFNGYGYSNGIYANEYRNRGPGYGYGYGYGYGFGF